jgi:hypothetical protein
VKIIRKAYEATQSFLNIPTSIEASPKGIILFCTDKEGILEIGI